MILPLTLLAVPSLSLPHCQILFCMYYYFYNDGAVSISELFFSLAWKGFFWQKNLHLSLSFEEQNEFDLHYPSFSFTKKKEPKKRVQSIQKQNCSVAELLPLEIIMSFYKNEVYALGISDTPKIKIQKYCGDLKKTQV